MQRQLYQLPVPSTAITSDVEMFHRGDKVVLTFSYDKDGVIYRSGLEFTAPTAVMHRAERCCTAEQIESSYDTLIELNDSEWLRQIKSDMAEGWSQSWETHHYRLYLDSAGCYELIADSWHALPEELDTGRS